MFIPTTAGEEKQNAKHFHTGFREIPTKTTSKGILFILTVPLEGCIIYPQCLSTH